MVHQVYYRIAWGWNNERIASAMQLSAQVVEETRGRIEDKLRAAGRTVPLKKMKTVSLSALSADGDAEGLPQVAEPSASIISPELRAEALGFWSKLTVSDRALLRLLGEGNSAKEVADALGMTASQVYSTIYRIRREMPEWFTA
jgi:DNA-binding CsgD family transcriptional regulator